MDTATRYPRRVARAKWTPPNPEVAAEIDAVVADFERIREDETKAKARLAKLADPTGPAVPIAHLAERLGVERKTVYRYLGRSMT
jgi:hypothetical protein